MADAPSLQTVALQISPDSVSKMANSGSGHYTYGCLTISWNYALVPSPSFTASGALFGYNFDEVTLNSTQLTNQVGGSLDLATAEVTLTLNIDTPSVTYQALVQFGSDTLYQKSGTISL